MQQLPMDFPTGITQEFPEFRDCLKASVYGCGRALKAVAADLDMTSSELSRKLGDNPNDPVHFPAHLLPALVTATKDRRPIFWLVESFLEEPEAKRARVVEEAAQMLGRLETLLAQVAAGPEAGRVKVVR